MSACPSKEKLSLFLNDSLPPAEQEQLSSHLEECPRCESLLLGLSDREVGGTPIGDRDWLRNACRKQSFENDDLVERILLRVRQRLGDRSRTSTRDTKKLSDLVLGESAFELDSREETTTAARVHAPPAGLEFAKFELLEQMPGGGMGMVFKARDKQLDRIVALKTIRPHEDGEIERETAERFHREARAMARLAGHAHIVDILEVGQSNGASYFTMPFLAGGSLRRKIGVMTDPKQIVSIVLKIARAVHHAHLHNVLHRDIKPSNVMFTEEGEPVVVDFGLASIADESNDLTVSGVILGTPPYMAPEQTDPDRDAVSPATDIWAIGVVLYEMLTGKKPFASNRIDQLYRDIRSREPVAPRKLRGDLDRGLEAIVLKCLRKDPQQRFGSAGELADELERWLEGKPLKTRPDTLLQSVRRWARRRPVFAVLALQCLLLLAAAPFGAFYASSDRPLWEAQSQIERQQATVLIAEKGGPRWSRWLNEPGVAGNDRENVFTVHSLINAVCLELLPKVPAKRYRISAEVRHAFGNRLTKVGIYFLHQKAKIGQERRDCFVQVSFNDQYDSSKPLLVRPGGIPVSMPGAPGNPLDFKPWVVVTPHPGAESATQQLAGLAGNPFRFQPIARFGMGHWRQLEVDVGPKEIEVFFDGRPAGRSTLAEIAKRYETNFARGGHSFRETIGDVRPTGGLGCFVMLGTGQFRNVVVMPRR